MAVPVLGSNMMGQRGCMVSGMAVRAVVAIHDTGSNAGGRAAPQVWHETQSGNPVSRHLSGHTK